MLDDPLVTLGLADAGAHVGQIMDASQPTFFLTYWVRERERWTLEEAIRRLTSDTADLFGFRDRGVLRAGAYADVNVIDFDNLTLPQPEYVHDFPNGAGRYVQAPGLRLHARERRGLHGPRRAHRRVGRTGRPFTRLDRPIRIAIGSSGGGSGHELAWSGRRRRGTMSSWTPRPMSAPT